MEQEHFLSSTLKILYFWLVYLLCYLQKIEPVPRCQLGTVAGFALGAAIGYAIGNFKINELNNQSVTEAAKDALIKTTDAIGDGLKTIGRWFS